ncbi:MAG: hypothetical protein V2J42_04865 [Wenzhouxiangella sp.]|jgi:hypothetical protein|nr:hypothetical protein [Wenzhouxiangella sp.]
MLSRGRVVVQIAAVWPGFPVSAGLTAALLLLAPRHFRALIAFKVEQALLKEKADLDRQLSARDLAPLNH